MCVRDQIFHAFESLFWTRVFFLDLVFNLIFFFELLLPFLAPYFQFFSSTRLYVYMYIYIVNILVLCYI
jgi:hypothetical protein